MKTNIRKLYLLMRLTGLRNYEFYAIRVYDNRICLQAKFNSNFVSYLCNKKIKIELSESGHIEVKINNIEITLT